MMIEDGFDEDIQGEEDVGFSSPSDSDSDSNAGELDSDSNAGESDADVYERERTPPSFSPPPRYSSEAPSVSLGEPFRPSLSRPIRRRLATKSAYRHPPSSPQQRHKAIRESVKAAFAEFTVEFKQALERASSDPSVVGFKSIACYRTGLDIIPTEEPLKQVEDSLARAIEAYQKTKKMRLADKKFNDYIVRMTMEVAGTCKKPVS